MKMLGILVICSSFFFALTQPLENNGTFSAAIEGEELVKLGRKLHKPMLTLVGLTLRNLHPCDEWTTWSSCSEHRMGHFGKQSRTRTCEYVGEKGPEILTEDKLCEGFCPDGHTITKHGYCLKLIEKSMSNEDANKHCKLDGRGFLVNIDTQEKYDDVLDFWKGDGGAIYIGGHRKDVSSPFEQEYGSQTGYRFWDRGEPNNVTDELCLIINSSTKLLHDNNCSYNRSFVCEIVST